MKKIGNQRVPVGCLVRSLFLWLGSVISPRSVVELVWCVVDYALIWLQFFALRCCNPKLYYYKVLSLNLRCTHHRNRHPATATTAPRW